MKTKSNGKTEIKNAIGSADNSDVEFLGEENKSQKSSLAVEKKVEKKVVTMLSKQGVMVSTEGKKNVTNANMGGITTLAVGGGKSNGVGAGEGKSVGTEKGVGKDSGKDVGGGVLVAGENDDDEDDTAAKIIRDLKVI